MSPADNASDGLRRVTGVDIERSVISPAGHDPGEQSAIQLGLPAGEPESLLDINGLLEIVKILSGIRKDGRLGGADEDRSNRVGE